MSEISSELARRALTLGHLSAVASALAPRKRPSTISAIATCRRSSRLLRPNNELQLANIAELKLYLGAREAEEAGDRVRFALGGYKRPMTASWPAGAKAIAISDGSQRYEIGVDETGAISTLSVEVVLARFPTTA